jgi:signal transduction histidine kinase
MASTIVQAHGGHIRSERVGAKGLRLVFTLSQDDGVSSAGRGM